MVKRINELIKATDGNGLLNGIGKPELLKYREACRQTHYTLSVLVSKYSVS